MVKFLESEIRLMGPLGWGVFETLRNGSVEPAVLDMAEKKCYHFLG